MSSLILLCEVLARYLGVAGQLGQPNVRGLQELSETL